jgi:hypothetical protein
MNFGAHTIKDRMEIKNCHDTKVGCTEPDPTPRITVKAKNAAKATARILKAAVNREPIRVSADELKRRDEICNACAKWKPSGNLGMGECTHPQCGCTRLKRGFATETCPMRKWP